MDKYGPTINWNLTGSLPSAMNFSRMGNATYVDENGYVTWAPANMLPNGDFTGAVKPSRFPDGWVSAATQDGITVTVEDTGYEDGTPYVDIRYTGTAGNTSGSLHIFAADNSFPASLGQSYTMSLHARRVGGSLAGVASVNIASREYANSTGLGASFENTVLALTTTKTRFHRTYECVEPTITQIRWGSRVVANLGETIDVTIRYYQGMMERTSYNSPRPYIPTRGSAYYGPRFDHDLVTGRPIGLLYEPQRTNLIRNNTMVGGVAGTLGSGASYPTNWGGYTNTTAGMVRTLSYGTENGLSYIDQRIYGTPSANYYQLFFETLTGIAGVQGNAFTASSYMRLSGGSTTNISHIKVGIQENNSSSSFLSSGTSGDLSLTSTFPTTPYAYARTLQSASTAYTRPFLQLEWTAGVSIDITLRIYQPQFEKASTYSSDIPTTGTPATRAADLLMLDIPDGISSLRYTFDDNSTQDVVVSPGSYTVPTNLNRPNIKRVVSV